MKKIYSTFSPSRFVLLSPSALSFVSSAGWQVSGNFVMASYRAENLTCSHG